ncbi:hypothetical protein [Cyclobacterium xiamenense]|uniref:hypothetical protein n=1 Tax=Cyclobacterium xiamenense TaxID=1297121 RepID=UPI0035CF210F
MSYKVIPTPNFKKLAKKLAKKYSSLKTELQDLIETLVENPASGTPLGHNLYKIRIKISSKTLGCKKTLTLFLKLTDFFTKLPGTELQIGIPMPFNVPTVRRGTFSSYLTQLWFSSP